MELPFLRDINKDYYQDFDYSHIGKLMIKILWWHFWVVLAWALLIYFFEPASLYPSPFSWRNLSFNETAGVIILGLFSVLLPALLRNGFKNHYYYRLLVAAAFTLFSFLIVFVSGSSIEAHFHIFAVLALLILFYDWRLGWFVLFLILAHRLILNYTMPTWLYHYGRNDFSLFAHLLFITLAVIFTTYIAKNGRKAVVMISQANKLISSKLGEKT